METPEQPTAQTPTQPESRPTPNDILQGFVWVAATHKSATVERIKLRLLNVREVVEYFRRLDGDPASCAELFAGKKSGWADSLQSSSVYEIVEIGERLNSVPFAEYLRFVQARSVRVQELTGAAESPSPDSSHASAT